jgi:hypothetical protein
MKELFPHQMQVGKMYYIQSKCVSGDGKQKGIFKSIDRSHPIEWIEFEKVENITTNGSGYATGYRHFRSNLCKFYLPEKEEIIERNLVNGLLKQITGDLSFFYYEGNLGSPRTPPPSFHLTLPPPPN